MREPYFESATPGTPSQDSGCYGRAFSRATLFAAAGALATIFGHVRCIVHDPQHRAVAGITFMLKASNSAQSTQTNSAGESHFEAVPVGEYTVSDATLVTQPQTITVLSGTAPILHFELRLPSEKQTITVSAKEGQSETVTPINIEGARITGWELTRVHRVSTVVARCTSRTQSSLHSAVVASTAVLRIFLLAAVAACWTTISATRCTSVAS